MSDERLKCQAHEACLCTCNQLISSLRKVLSTCKRHEYKCQLLVKLYHSYVHSYVASYSIIMRKLLHTSKHVMCIFANSDVE